MKKETQPKIVKWGKEEVIDLCREQKITPYIKPTRYIHESGYRCFEVGYCKIGNSNKVAEKMVLYEGTDHVWFHDLLEGKNGRGVGKFSLSMDLTRDGYIRFYRRFMWTDYDMGFSTMELTYLEQKGVL